jgi:solute carrier family 25 (peroxisomal adenine nucleotide transporter), member 17
MRIVKEEGIAGCFKGFSATMLNTFSMRACLHLLSIFRLAYPKNLEYAYFFFYSFVRGAYLRRLAAKLPKGSKLPALSTAMELILGAVAGALAQIFTIPVSVIATRQQIGRPLDKQRGRASMRKPSLSYAAVASAPATAPAAKAGDATASPVNSEGGYTDDSFFAVAREIVEEEGVGGLWLGIKPGLVLTVNPAITYGVYERVKSAVLAGATVGAKLSPGQAFLVGAFSKTLATIVSRMIIGR